MPTNALQTAREALVTASIDGAPAYNHAPSIIVLANGHIVVLWQGGTSEDNDDMSIWRIVSTDGGSTWSSPTAVISETYACGGPSLIEYSGTLYCVYHRSTVSGLDGGDICLRTSADEGATWSAAAVIWSAAADGGERKSSPNGGIIELSNGVWLVCAHTKTSGQTYALRSTNYGSSWTAVGPVNSANRLIEAGCVEQDAAGGVTMYGRSDIGYIRTATSSDYGASWTDASSTSLVNPNSKVFVEQDGDGAWWLAYNPRTTFPERAPLHVLRSSDEGSNWTHAWTLESHRAAGTYPANAYAYPTLHVSGDDIYAVWSEDVANIWWATVDLAAQGDDEIVMGLHGEELWQGTVRTAWQEISGSLRVQPAWNEATAGADDKVLLHLNEGQGATAFDDSGNGNNFTVTGTEGWNTSDPWLGEADFVCQSGRRIRATNVSDLNFGTGSCTWECWFKAGTPTQTLHSLLSSYYGISTDSMGIRWQVSENVMDCFARTAAAGIVRVRIPFTGDTNWHHVAMVKDGTDVRGYMDGTYYGTAAGATANYANCQEVRVGDYIPDSARAWIGTIDEVRIRSGAQYAAEDFTINRYLTAALQSNAIDAGESVTPGDLTVTMPSAISTEGWTVYGKSASDVATAETDADWTLLGSDVDGNDVLDASGLSANRYYSFKWVPTLAGDLGLYAPQLTKTVLAYTTAPTPIIESAPWTIGATATLTVRDVSGEQFASNGRRAQSYLPSIGRLAQEFFASGGRRA